MDNQAVPVSAEQVLAVFYARTPILRHPSMFVRARRVRTHLETYLDTEAEQWLTDAERTLVEAERQIDPAGAVGRVTGPEALLATLPGFVDPEWMMPGVHQARAQLVVVASLVRWLVESGLVDRAEMSCSVLEVQTRLELAWRHVGARATSALSP
ncbi:hypothetical protein ATJ97_3408 [Georgenia soli]|uniref:Uncharacterized protein n=1 Tax=Georgenia soli TaxID=638953 RepID=A0A2A9EP50_9MICO|nr:hypothetical protein [Georgenia soli]PFG40867.1 hypothetical protein ATJ97_3408 [Georgenia soli]